MKKFTVLLCLLIGSTVRADNPLPRVTCNGIFYGYPATLNFQGATCTGIGGVNAVNVAPATGPAGPPGPTGATGATGPAGNDLSAEPLITKIASANLSNEFALGSLANGLLLNTAVTGVPTIYTGASCPANQYSNALDASGAELCAQVTTAQLSGTVTNAQLASTYSGVGGCAAHNWTSTLNGNAAPTCTRPDYSDLTGTPTIPADVSGASYITKVAEAGLSNEFALGSLATGLLKNTTTTGVPTIYAGATCAYAIQTLDASGAASACQAAPTIPADISGASYITKVSEAGLSNEFALGSLATGILKNTTTTGVPTIAVAGTDYQSPLTFPINTGSGGTGGTASPTSGAVAYGTGSAYAFNAAGTAGQALYSGGTGTPTWNDEMKVIRLTSDYTNATTSMTNTALTWTSPAQVSRSGFTCKVMVKSSVTTIGAQFDVNVSVAPTTITYWVQWISATGTPPSTVGTWNNITATASATAIGPTTGLTTYTIGTVEGIIVHTASAATVTIRGKASGVGTITVGSGSWCSYYVL